MPFRPLYLAGQTASGKSAVALELARRYGPAEIFNADAFQAYRGMEILTAAPVEADLRAVPHHGYGTIDPGEECDAASFAERTRPLIEEISARALPLVVGGSGLYLKALTHGLAPTPPGDPGLRRELDALSLDELMERYRRLDPEGAAATDPRNRRYVTRNLEICLLAGQPASGIKHRWQREAPDIRGIFLKRGREDLTDRIEHRARAMMEGGAIEEVTALGEISTTAEKAIGLREIRRHLAGELAREECLEQIQRQTRKYAKRQESWFRREPAFVEIPVSKDDSAATIADRIEQIHPLP